jgi:predicted Na+-dependent transporter
LLLSFVLPAAVSSPAFTVIYGGKPDLSLKLLIISSFLSVLSIPFLLSWLLASSVHIDALKMLLTLIYTILVPSLVHIPLRKVTKFKLFIERNNPLFTLAGLGSIFILVTAYNKDAFFSHPHKAAIYALISIVIYAAMYLIGYFLLPAQHKDVKTTFAISSGANNIGLGVTLTALFFKGETNAFFIVSQLMWIVMLIPLRKVLGKTV